VDEAAAGAALRAAGSLDLTARCAEQARALLQPSALSSSVWHVAPHAVAQEPRMRIPMSAGDCNAAACLEHNGRLDHMYQPAAPFRRVAAWIGTNWQGLVVGHGNSRQARGAGGVTSGRNSLKRQRNGQRREARPRLRAGGRLGRFQARRRGPRGAATAPAPAPRRPRRSRARARGTRGRP
jgi:hypothetical protein